MNNKDLINKLLGDNNETIESFIQNNYEKIFRVCIGFVDTKENAEDLTQEVFAEFLISINSFRQEALLSTWLYRIAINKSLNFIKKQKRVAAYHQFLNTLTLNQVKSTDIPNQIEQKELNNLLQTAINKLPENQKIAYTLANHNELSYADIAKIMNLSISSIESLLFRAKQNLKKMLITYYEKNYK
ncbi:MAG: RNA polymerase sigma factor [Bacteroidetes bacterium]|nr:RNA polymerase sigma factor [Bacteroidota bacterium]